MYCFVHRGELFCWRPANPNFRHWEYLDHRLGDRWPISEGTGLGTLTKFNVPESIKEAEDSRKLTSHPKGGYQASAGPPFFFGGVLIQSKTPRKWVAVPYKKTWMGVKKGAWKPTDES